MKHLYKPEHFEIIDEKPYRRKETAELIGANESMLDRLIASGEIKPDWHNNTCPIFLGKTIKAYRDGKNGNGN